MNLRIMMKNRRGSLLLAVVVCFLKCTAPEPSAAAQSPDPTSPGPFTVVKEEYDFGDTAFTPAGFPAPVEVRGSVHYPLEFSNGSRPVLIFLHGRHGVCYQGTSAGNFQWPCPAGQLPIPSYAGYDYLASLLASQGYFVISISADGINAVDNTTADFGASARAQLIQRHLDLWNTFNTVGGEPFGTKFVGRLNLQRVGTMGHSRGGEGVVSHFIFNQASGSPYGIKAVFPLAPVDFNREIINQVPLGVLLPYCDGDVNDLAGVHFYDDSRYNLPGDPAPKHTFLVMGANHNFYNTVWTPGLFPASTSDDWSTSMTRAGDPFCGTVPGNQRLSDSRQRSTALVYITAFFRVYVGGETQFAPLLTGASPPPASATTQDIFATYHAPDVPGLRRDVNRLTNVANLTTNTLDGAVTPAGLMPFSLCGGPAQPDCLLGQIAARQPHTNGLSQLTTGWLDSTASLIHDIPAGQRDVHGFEALQFRASVNFIDARNIAMRPQDFSVVLTDGLGRSGSVRVGQVSRALFFPPGSVSFVPKLVLNTVRIPLSGFAGIDLTDVRTVQFRFNQISMGALLITDVAFASQPFAPQPPPLPPSVVCVQDGTRFIKVNTLTGAYEFHDCAKGITLTGTGALSTSSCKIELKDLGANPKKPDRSVFVSINTCANTGTASVQVSPTAAVASISDGDLASGTCTCP